MIPDRVPPSARLRLSARTAVSWLWPRCPARTSPGPRRGSPRRPGRAGGRAGCHAVQPGVHLLVDLRADPLDRPFGHRTVMRLAELALRGSLLDPKGLCGDFRREEVANHGVDRLAVPICDREHREMAPRAVDDPQFAVWDQGLLIL